MTLPDTINPPNPILQVLAAILTDQGYLIHTNDNHLVTCRPSHNTYIIITHHQDSLLFQTGELNNYQHDNYIIKNTVALRHTITSLPLKDIDEAQLLATVHNHFKEQ